MDRRGHWHIRNLDKIVAIEFQCRPLGATDASRVADRRARKSIAAIISNITGVKAPIPHETLVDCGLSKEGPEGEEDACNENWPQRSHVCSFLFDTRGHWLNRNRHRCEGAWLNVQSHGLAMVCGYIVEPLCMWCVMRGLSIRLTNVKKKLPSRFSLYL